MYSTKHSTAMVAIILATFFTPAFSAPIYVCSDLESGVLKMNTIKNAVDIGNIIVSGVQGIKQMFSKSQRRDFELEELLARDFITAEDLFLGDEHEWYARDPSPAEESGTLGLGKLLATAAKFIIRDEPEIFARAGDQESGALNIGSILDTAAKILFREEPELLSRALNERLQYAKRGIRERDVTGLIERAGQSDESGALGLGKVLSTAAKIFVREEPDLVTRAREKEGAFGVTKATSNAAMIFLREEPECLARSFEDLD